MQTLDNLVNSQQDFSFKGEFIIVWLEFWLNIELEKKERREVYKHLLPPLPSTSIIIFSSVFRYIVCFLKRVIAQI